MNRNLIRRLVDKRGGVRDTLGDPERNEFATSWQAGSVLGGKKQADRAAPHGIARKAPLIFIVPTFTPLPRTCLHLGDYARGLLQNA